MEPSEGHYDFDWLERAVNLAGKHGIVSVLGTPTGGPPAWPTQKYADTLRVLENGRPATQGTRAHGSVMSPRYRGFCRRVAEQMAMRFGHNPNVVGWQIDNASSAASREPCERSRGFSLGCCAGSDSTVRQSGIN